MGEVLIDGLQFIAVFLALQFLALLLCFVFFPTIPATIAAVLAGALSRARSSRSPASRQSRNPGRYDRDDDLDLIAALQSMEDNAGHGSR